MKKLTVAIDGPAGAGKSTVAKALAKDLGLDYIDTGAMYRAFALKIKRTGTDYNDPEELAALLASTQLDFVQSRIYLDGEDVSGLIRTQEISDLASASSAVPAIREKLAGLQAEMGRTKDCVMDGRDIASVVIPDAELKLFLTASVRVRALRRLKDLEAKGEAAVLEDVEKEIEERDYRDSHREASPLVQVEDAVLVDTSDMSIEETVEYIKSLINR